MHFMVLAGNTLNIQNFSSNASPGIELGKVLTPEQLLVSFGQVTGLKVRAFIEIVN